MNLTDCNFEEITELYFRLYSKVISPISSTLGVLTLLLIIYLFTITNGHVAVFIISAVVLLIVLLILILKWESEGYYSKDYYSPNENIFHKFLGIILIKRSSDISKKLLWYRFHYKKLEGVIYDLENKINRDKKSLGGVIYDKDDVVKLAELNHELSKLDSEFKQIIN